MRDIGQAAVIFLLILVFVTLLSFGIGWKFHRLLKSLKEVMKLEISSQAGRVSLVTNFLIAVLFLIVFTSHEAMALVKAFIKTDLEVFTFNYPFAITVVALMFVANLIVL